MENFIRMINSKPEPLSSEEIQKLNFMTDLEDKNWIGELIECDICTHKWAAVYHESCSSLVCPNCSNRTLV